MKRDSSALRLPLLLLLVGLLGLLVFAFWLWAFGFGDGGGAASGPDPLAASAPLPSSVQSVARGAYLARAGNCMTCHTARGGAAYAGGRAIDTPFGTVHASNLTPDPRTGIGGWSSGEFWNALHHGRSRDGRLLYPAFPYTSYTRVTRADSDALFGYLQTLAPVERPNTAHRLRWPYSTQTALAVWRALYFRPATHRDDAARSAEWNRGAYLVQGLGHCSACHSARNALGATVGVMDLSGGMIPMQNWYAPSLASRSEASVAGWETEHVVRLLRTGVAPRATVLGPMAEVVLNSTQHLDAADLQAMAVYLKALPQTDADAATASRKTVSASPGVGERAAKLYGQHCAQCHGEQGQGVPGAYPPLAGNRAVTLPVTANLVQIVLHGGYPPATAGNPRPFGMPPYALQLSDAEVALVLTHIRSAWGNRAAAVSELAVAQQRGSTPP